MEKEIHVTKAVLPPIEEYYEEIRDLWDSHWITNMGDKHKQFSAMLIDYLGVSNIELVVNGHMSLELALQTMELKGEVITTPFTFASTTHAIIRSGLTPVFCDIDPETYTIDVSKIESLITEKTCAILPVHVYGNICNIDRIAEIASKHNLKVVYDAAHVFGVKYKGIGIGNYGDAVCFSFHATKVFNSIEGGGVTFREPSLGDRLKDLKNFGIKGPEEILSVGLNAKLNEFCAAMGICNLRHVDDEIKKRKKIDDEYRNQLGDVNGIKLNSINSDVRYNYGYFPIVIDENVFGINRDELHKRLEKEGFYTRKYFYPLTNEIPEVKNSFDAGNTPIAVKVSRSVLTLPIFSDLKLDDVSKICDIIRS